MKQGKDLKPKQKPSRDSEFGGAFSYDQMFNNRLSIPASLKAYLKEQGLSWRFLNANEFRVNGSMHRSHWKPFKVPAEQKTDLETTAEGLICRGDLILGVRDEQITSMHKKFLKDRTDRQTSSTKDSAKQLRAMAREAGVEKMKITEGYDEDDRGYKSVRGEDGE